MQVYPKHISSGHTTDFYLGKNDLHRANSSKINSSRVLFYLGKNSGKVTLLILAPKVFTPVEFFGAYKFKKAKCTGI